MELAELQEMWNQHDKNIQENTRINKEILKNILVEKNEKKLSWVRLTAIINLILPIAILTILLIPRVEFSTEISFIIGAGLFAFVFVLFYFWSFQYFLKVSGIDFRSSITNTKKDLAELEKYKFKVSKLKYILIPFAGIGIFIMAEIPLFSKESVMPLLLIAIVMLISIYFTFKFSIVGFFRKINKEIAELEKLEKE